MMKDLLALLALAGFLVGTPPAAQASSAPADGVWCTESIANGTMCVIGGLILIALMTGSPSGGEVVAGSSEGGSGGGFSDVPMGGAGRSSPPPVHTEPVDHSPDFGCVWGSHKYGTCH
jgi:hypothetical protein